MSGTVEVRRLLVALDASAHSLAALEAAVRLAERLDVELAGLFIEDEDVLRWSRLPIGRAVDPRSASARSVDAAAVEKELAAQALRARGALETAAARAKLRWSFRVARGRVGRALTEASGESDLLALGRNSWAQSSAGPLGSTARFVLTESRSRVLLVGEGESVDEPVALLHARGEEGERAFQTAVALARRDGGRLILLVPGSDSEAAALAQELAGGAGDLELRSRALASVEPRAVAAAVRGEAARLLVLPARACSQSEEGLAGFFEAAPCPVLSVR